MTTLKSNNSRDSICFTLDLENATASFVIGSIEVLQNNLVLVSTMLQRIELEDGIDTITMPFKTKGGRNIEKVVIEKVPIVEASTKPVQKKSTPLGKMSTKNMDPNSSVAMIAQMYNNTIKTTSKEEDVPDVQDNTEKAEEQAEEQAEEKADEKADEAPKQKMKEVRRKVKEWKWNNVCYVPKNLNVMMTKRDKEGNCTFTIAVGDFMRFYEANLDNIITRDMMNSNSFENEPDEDGFIMNRNTKKERNRFKRDLEKDMNELREKTCSELKEEMKEIYEEQKKIYDERKEKKLSEDAEMEKLKQELEKDIKLDEEKTDSKKLSNRTEQVSHA